VDVDAFSSRVIRGDTGFADGRLCCVAMLMAEDVLVPKALALMRRREEDHVYVWDLFLDVVRILC